MRKKSMITKCSIFILCLTMGVFFVSCSSDDGGDSGDVDTNSSDCLPDSAEIPENLLGTYTNSPDATGLANEIDTATLVKTDCKTYTINFSNSFAPITGLTFANLSMGDNTGFLTSDKEEKIAISVSSTEEGTILSVVKSSDPIILFTGFK